MRPTLFDHAGGEVAFLALARAHHTRCLADPELNHPFSHEDQHPEHVERLAAYWGEVMGGPPTYSKRAATSRASSGCIPVTATWVISASASTTCFVHALDDAELPDDAAFRTAMQAYMRWAVDNVLAYPEEDAVAPGIAMPRWSWNGLQSD